jgi:hypothetical protein
VLYNGNSLRFWRDPWLDAVPWVDSYPLLFDICQGQDWTFAKMANSNRVAPFRRRLLPRLQEQWDYIKGKDVDVPGSLSCDGVTWEFRLTGCLLLNPCINTWRRTYQAYITNGFENQHFLLK